MDATPNFQNIATNAKIDAEGNIIMGNNNQVVTNVYYSAQYKDLQKQLEDYNARFEKATAKSQKYPDDEDFKVELLEIDKNRAGVTQKIDTLKREVLQLAEEFSKIPINTERLRLAKEHFEKSDYDKARAVLDTDKMSVELEQLLAQKENLSQSLSENEQQLIDKSNEYLVLARLTAIDFEQVDFFEKTIQFFEKSLKAAKNQENIFAYAYFLQENKQFQEAISLYEELVPVCRELAQSQANAHLSDLAAILNNLGLLHNDCHEFDTADKCYTEALEIRRILAQSQPRVYLSYVAMTLNNLGLLYIGLQKFEAVEKCYTETLAIYRNLEQLQPKAYLFYVATTLNNLASLHHGRHEFDEAKNCYTEALAIYRDLVQSQPQAYLPYLAMNLNNLANLYRDCYKFEAAENCYAEALEIRRDLAQSQPQVYLRNVATTLNNWANLQNDQHEFETAEKHYTEALDIYEALAKLQPQAYSTNLAMTSLNFAIFYSKSKPNKEKSLVSAYKCMISAFPFIKNIPICKEYFGRAVQIIKDWEENPEVYIAQVLEYYGIEE